MPSNIDAVIDDVGDVGDDLRNNLRNNIMNMMFTMMRSMLAHVNHDARWRGNLATSITAHGVRYSETVNRMEFTVGTDASIAPYGPFVEFGTGERTLQSHSGSASTQFPHDMPPGFPYESPDVDPQRLAGEITEWVKTKPLVPKNVGTQEALGYVIAESIIEHGTYAHPFVRPAWYKNVLRVKRTAKKAVRDATR